MKYKINSDLHTHTVFSHGKNEIEENVRTAIAKGLTTIAITDHGPGHPLFGVKREKIKVMREQIDKLNDKYKEINILLGIEANLMSLEGDTDIEDEHLQYYDILLMGFHKLGFYMKELPSFVVAPVFAREKWAEKFAYSYKKAMERYPIDIITHPDYGIKVNMDLLSQFALENNVALEVNSSHMSMDMDAIKTASKMGVMLTVNSDAHDFTNVGNLNRGLIALERAQVPAQQILNTYEKPTFRNNRGNEK